MVKSRLLGAVGIVAVVGGIAVVVAQTPAANPTFEVASIKPNNSSLPMTAVQLEPGGRWTFTNATLRTLVLRAYNLQGFQLAGGPSWVTAERFDVLAKASADAPRSQYPTMLQALLADRFRLRTHSEKRTLPAFVLTFDKSEKLGPRLHRSTIDCDEARRRSPGDASGNVTPICGMRQSGGHLSAQAQPMTMLVTMLSQISGRGVVDQTGLDGDFDFDLEWALDQGSGAAALVTDAPSIFTAVQEQLGLKLQPAREPLDVLVIDSAEHPTAD